MSEEFYKAAELSDLREGKLYSVEVDGEPVCLVRLEGTVYAFTDNCTHISGPLNQGDFDGCAVTCPWHGARFDVRSGKVLRGPARQDLYTYPVKVEGENIYIGLPPQEE
ncbi:(2Fe-2S)-binding protein [Dictyobacter sp. S3.2.2.5]|uniref:(2Fe-2S)-binding protein n=1 Tax=Dictyobacter halimunensis TaxID=3026934 RepID=A0ABQ6FVU0_9CHLR|nr:(2Fe-2S)-binding protein [Dictyobacter sp. S3.2.2.5]